MGWITNLPPPLQPENTSLVRMRRRLEATKPPRTTLPPTTPTPTPACTAIDLTQLLNIPWFDPPTLRDQLLQNLWPTSLALTQLKCPLPLSQHGALLLLPAWRHQVVQWAGVVQTWVSQVAKLIRRNHLEGPTRLPSLLLMSLAWRGRSLSTPALM